MSARWAIVAVLLVAATLYFRAVGAVPVYIGGDEARFATGASSIAATGRDLAGHRLPLFFHLSDSLAGEQEGTRWYQPLLFYLMAVAFRFMPVTEQSMRLPTAVIGMLDIVLIYGVARRLFGDHWSATLAAVLLALSPAHFIFSRQALDYICPLPFVLGWLWCLMVALETGSVWLSLASGIILGVGFYSYVASWVTMPLLLLITWAAHYQSGVKSSRAGLAAAIGFAVPVVAAITWLSFHPDMWRDLAMRYNMYDPLRLSPIRGPTDFLNRGNVVERVSVYWDYFNPAYLFFAGGSNLSTATRQVGVFLLPVSVFLACGLPAVWRQSAATKTILIAGLAVAPLPATLVGERYAIQRELIVLPFVVLIATFGAMFLLRHTTRAARLAGVALLLAMPAQFAAFYYDYFNDYRIRSAFSFDPANFRGVAEFLLSSETSGRTPPVYLSEDLDDVAARWRFYLAKHRREDLLQRTSLFTARDLDVSKVPPGSLLVLYANDPAVHALLGPEKCAVASVVTDISGGRSAVILRKAS